MPGALVERNELYDFAVSLDQQMSRNLELMNFAKIGMIIGLKRVAKQSLDMRRAEFAGWQADAMNHN